MIKDSGNIIYGGSTGVQEKYFSGNALGNAAWSVDITHSDDSSQGTILHIQAAYTHHPDYDAILDTWYSRRGTSGSNRSTEQYRRDTVASGNWSVSSVSGTVTRVTHNAGNYGGGGPWWVKVVWKNR